MTKIINSQNIATFIELIPDMAFFKDMQGHYIYFNDAYLKFIDKSRDEVSNKTVFDLYSKKQAKKISRDDKNILKENRDKSYEEVFVKDDGERLFFDTTKQILYDAQNQPIGLFCILKDITAQKEYESIHKDTKKILEYISINNDLKKTLDEIVSLAQKRLPKAKCSILLLAKDKKHLVEGSTKSLPNFYNKAVNGIAIGPKVGACGSAAFKQERVIIENIDTHENWQPYLTLTKKANLHACWSEPIFSSKHKLLGTFAIYHDVAKQPSAYQLTLINSYANLAAIAIEKENNENILLAKERELSEQIKKSNTELSALFDNALVGLMYVTGNRILTKANQRLADIFGYDNPQEMIGLSMQALHLSKKRFIAFGVKNFQSLVNGENNHIEYKLRKKDGSCVWAELSGKALDKSVPIDLHKGVLWTVSDISNRKKLEGKVLKRTLELEKMSILDELTALYNRKYYNDKITEILSLYKRYDTPFSMIMYDIDDFKNINDTYGHQIGDKVLIEMSRLIHSLLRETDLLFRVGGEEFVILIPELTVQKALLIAEKIRKRVSKLNIIKNEQITISMGLTEVEQNDTADSIFQRVDRLLYYSKKHGKNMVSTKIEGDISYSYYFDKSTNTLYERISGSYMNMNAFKNTLMNKEYVIEYLECENIITDFRGLEMVFEHYKEEVIEMFTEYARLYLEYKENHFKNKKSASFIYKFDNTDSVRPFRELQASVGVETGNFEKIEDISKFIGFNVKKYFEMPLSALTVCK